MGPRLALQKLLSEVLGSDKVYFQPPANITLTYPCIVYSMETFDAQNADNNNYRMHKRYQVTYISRNPESEVPNQLQALPLCSHSNRFVSDNLYHDVFTIYF